MSTAQLSSRDRSLATIASLVAVATIAQQVAGKATRDALFLSHFDASSLPTVMGASALLAVVVVLSVSRVLSRFAPGRVVPFFFLAHASLYAAEWVLADSQPRIAGVLVYLHTASAGAAVVSTFWSIVNESFDPHAAKAAIGRIAAGATAGGVIGGLGVWRLSQVAGVRSLLLALAVINVIVAVGLVAVVRRAASGAEKVASTTPSAPLNVAAVLRKPYLRILVVVVALGAFGDTALDYVFKAAAADAYSDGVELAAFFSLFHTIVGVATFAIQLLFVRRALSRFGIAATIASLPGTVVVVGVGAIFAPVLATVTALRGAAMSIENSLFRSAYELTYTAVPPAEKRPTKTVIDVGSDKIAAALASGLIFVILFVAPDIADRLLLTIGVGAAVLLLMLIGPLHRGYVRVLADGLRSGAIELEDADEDGELDLTTRKTLAETVSLSRSKLLEEIAAQRAASGPSEADVRRSQAISQIENDEPLTDDGVDDLIELLADGEHLTAAVARLRSAPDLVIDRLLERLAARSGSPVVRRRIPRVLRAFGRQPIVDGLVGALEDPVYEVRYRAAVALLSITARHPALEVDANHIFSLAQTELDSQHRDRPILSDDALDDRSPFDDEGAKVLGRRLTYVFTMLALVVDREPLHLSFCALASSNKQLRGTGLEFLDSVLPIGLRKRLNPYLRVQEVATRISRPRRQIVSELMQSKDSLAFDRKQLLELLKPTE